MDVIKVNTNDDNYYDNFYKIFLWSGCGYWLQQFDVYANDLEEALCLIVAWCERNGYNGYLLDVDSVENEDGLIYIDATIQDATKPYYIFSENLKVEETKLKGA